MAPPPATRRLEVEIAAHLQRGLTYAAVALALATTRHVVEYTARRLGIKRPPGRPRASAPDRIPSAAPPPPRW